MPQVYRMDLLQSALAKLCNSLDGVHVAVIVSIEGFVVASYPPGEESFVENGSANSSQVAAMAATLVALSERLRPSPDRLLFRRQADQLPGPGTDPAVRPLAEQRGRVLP